MDDLRIPLIDSAFSPYSRSASLREENKDVHPTYFKWATGPDYPGGYNYFYTDNAILSRDHFARNAVAWLLEPRCLRPENYEAAKEKAHHFKAVLSYDKEFLKEVPNGRWYALGGSSISLDKWGVYPKTKDVCLFVSGKRTTEGHQLRHEIAAEFEGRIDIYGEGVGRPVSSKFEVLKDYKYCVVVESCYIRDYFSEKLIDCFAVGTIPIYLSYTTGLSIVLGVEKFLTLEQLTLLLDAIKKFDFYILKAMKIQTNLFDAKHYRICEDWIYEHHGDLFEHE